MRDYLLIHLSSIFLNKPLEDALIFFSWQTPSKEISIQHINNKGTILTSEVATGGVLNEKVLFLEKTPVPKSLLQ